MTDETKNLFDAPWTICHGLQDGYGARDNTGNMVFEFAYPQDARRLARLPELYDALNKQAYYRCVDCLRHTAKTIDDIPLNRDMIEHGCPKNRTDCGAFDVWELLRKVRDGE